MAKGGGADSCEYPPPEQLLLPIVDTELDFCVIYHCAFSVKLLYLSAWVRIPPKSHFNYVLSPMLHWANILHGISNANRLHSVVGSDLDFYIIAPFL